MATDRISPTTPASDADDQAAASRLASLDALRGLIIVLMAIDHARAFIARNQPVRVLGGGATRTIRVTGWHF